MDLSLEVKKLRKLTREQIKRRLQKISAFYYRTRLKNKDFTIISNNCWGG